MAGRPDDRPDRDRVRPAPTFPEAPAAGPVPGADHRRGLEGRGGERQGGGSVRRLSPPEAGRAPPPAHGARRGLRAARLVSLRARLALFGAGVVALALLIFGLLLYALLSRAAVTNQDDALRTRAHQAASSLSVPTVPQAPIAPIDIRSSPDVFVEVLTPDGSIASTTGLLDGSPPAAAPSLLDQARQHPGAFATQGPLRLYVLPYAGGYLLTGQSTRVVQSNVSGIVVFLVISSIPALAAALIASWLLAGSALAPLKATRVAAEDIGRTPDFGRRLSATGGRDEGAALPAGFHGMLSRLQDAFESQRRFVADGHHELSTPLTH